MQTWGLASMRVFAFIQQISDVRSLVYTNTLMTSLNFRPPNSGRESSEQNTDTTLMWRSERSPNTTAFSTNAPFSAVQSEPYHFSGHQSIRWKQVSRSLILKNSRKSMSLMSFNVPFFFRRTKIYEHRNPLFPLIIKRGPYEKYKWAASQNTIIFIFCMFCPAPYLVLKLSLEFCLSHSVYAQPSSFKLCPMYCVLGKCIGITIVELAWWTFKETAPYQNVKLFVRLALVK